MQERDGTMRLLEEDEVKALPPNIAGRVLTTGIPFKVRKCYFKVGDFSPTGFVAVGITRKEYYDLKRAGK